MRFEPFESDAVQAGYCRIAGIDEAGRGPLAPRLPLDAVIGGAAPADQPHARRLEGVRDRLILRRGPQRDGADFLRAVEVREEPGTAC